METKKAILMMLVAMAIIGISVSSVSAYTYKGKCQTDAGLPWGYTTDPDADYYGFAYCDATNQGNNNYYITYDSSQHPWSSGYEYVANRHWNGATTDTYLSVSDCDDGVTNAMESFGGYSSTLGHHISEVYIW